MKTLRRMTLSLLMTIGVVLALLSATKAHAQGPLYCFQLWDFMNGNGGTIVESWYVGGSIWGNQFILQGQTGTIYCMG